MRVKNHARWCDWGGQQFFVVDNEIVDLERRVFRLFGVVTKIYQAFINPKVKRFRVQRSGLKNAQLSFIKRLLPTS